MSWPRTWQVAKRQARVFVCLLFAGRTARVYVETEDEMVLAATLRGPAALVGRCLEPEFRMAAASSLPTPAPAAYKELGRWAFVGNQPANGNVERFC